MISYLHLINFRNHINYKTDIDTPVVVVSGNNGVGKTNILEAISLFAPGRSMRNCKFDEIITNNQNIMNEWGVHIRYDEQNFSTGYASNTLRKFQKDGEVLKSQAEILQYMKILWMLPQMESLFSGSSTIRRKFFDRICYNLNHEHAKNIIRYEYYLKTRLKILQQRSLTDEWLDAIESSLASLCVLICAARIRTLDILKNELASNAHIPLRPYIQFKSVRNQNNNDELTWKSMWRDFRKQDLVTGRSNIGTHKEDLIIVNSANNQKAALCSTGEQKAILLALFIAQAKAIKKVCGLSPIMLMDEIFSYFDNNKQNIILQELPSLSAQIWLTTTKTAQEFQSILQKGQVMWLNL